MTRATKETGLSPIHYLYISAWLIGVKMMSAIAMIIATVIVDRKGFKRQYIISMMIGTNVRLSSKGKISLSFQ